MLLLDDLLLSPFTGLLWVFGKINDAVQLEKAGEPESVTRSLSDLYVKLEMGVITEEQFSAEETRLLDRLDAIDLRNAGDDAESDDAANEEADGEFDPGEAERH